MPRTARQIATSGIYHIMLRGINRQDIFTDDTDRQRFLQLLEQLPQDYKTTHPLESGFPTPAPSMPTASCQITSTSSIDKALRKLTNP